MRDGTALTEQPNEQPTRKSGGQSLLSLGVLSEARSRRRTNRLLAAAIVAALACIGWTAIALVLDLAGVIVL